VTGQQSEDPAVEFLLLADRADAVNGKLYMAGGGWDRLIVTSIEEPVALSIAVGVLIPRGHAQNKQILRVHAESPSGEILQPQIHAELPSGLPAEAIPNEPLRSMIAINGLWRFPQAGVYHLEARISGSAPKRIAFQIVEGAPPYPRLSSTPG
jgi:hypothetical protein